MAERAVQLAGFHNCCGILILWDFYKGPDPQNPSLWKTYGYQDSAIVELVNIRTRTEDLETYQKRLKTQLNKCVADFKNQKSYFLAALNEVEDKVASSVMLECGFEVLVPMTKNPTGSKIILYIYHLLPRESKPVKSVFAA